MVRLATSSMANYSLSTIPSSPSSSSSSPFPILGNSSDLATLTDLVKYIPLRLTEEERSLLTVLEQTLNVSEYTDHVDVAISVSRRGVKARRILDGILEVCHIAIGLTIASGQGRLFQLPQQEEEGNGSRSHKKTRTSNPFRAKKKKKEAQKRNGSGHRQYSSRLSAAATTTSPPISDTSSSISLKQYAPLLQRMFEVGRRNKVLNPNQMRTTYGKLMYLLQDAQAPSIAKSLGFSLFQELHLVGPYLEQNKAACLLRDERLLVATQYIVASNTNTTTQTSASGSDNEMEEDAGKTAAKAVPLNNRAVIQQRVAQKHQALEALVEEYSTPATLLSTDELRRCIESIADAVAYVQANVTPVQAMMNYLTTHFDPQQIQKGFSLEIIGCGGGGSSLYPRYNMYEGRLSYSSSSSSSSSGGATLSHSHSTQYTFVWQTLQLWSKVMHHMHALWVCADSDLLSTSTSYHLYNTGQGLQRVQSCPKVAKAMRQLLMAAQQQTQSPWVGLSVIHLGDRDVPNALIFIDKYAQIPRFLHPLVSVCQSLPVAQTDERLERYLVRQFNSVDRLVQIVLTDYFRHGFDGSGDDGGSCIDGRLTSSWNWTSRLAKKSYYYAFLLCGFQGFDGDFK